MVRTIFVIAVGIFSVGCSDQKSATARASFEEQQRKQTKKELDKIQSQINQNIQKNIKTGQDAINAAKPRIRR